VYTYKNIDEEWGHWQDEWHPQRGPRLPSPNLVREGPNE